MSKANRSMKSDLSAEEVRNLLEYDPETGVFTWKERTRDSFQTARSFAIWNTQFARRRAGTLGNCGYIGIKIDGSRYGAHRLAYVYMTGSWPTDQIDHIDHARANNRWSNLRPATNAENRKNLSIRSDNTSGVVGVYWQKDAGKWRAQIVSNGRHTSLGKFDSFDTAVSARLAAEVEQGFHQNHGRGK